MDDLDLSPLTEHDPIKNSLGHLSLHETGQCADPKNYENDDIQEEGCFPCAPQTTDVALRHMPPSRMPDQVEESFPGVLEKETREGSDLPKGMAERENEFSHAKPLLNTPTVEPDPVQEAQDQRDVAPPTMVVHTNGPKRAIDYKVDDTFRSFNLLARALEEEVLMNSFVEDGILTGLEFGSVREEVNLMRGEQGLVASTTLLVPYKPIPTYKPYGFLFDAREAEILGAYKQDCNSCKNDRGVPVLPEDGKLSLPDLAVSILDSTSVAMNEVYAKLVTPLALFVRSGSPKALIEVMHVKDYLKKRFSMELQLFIYDHKAGTFKSFPDGREIRRKAVQEFKYFPGCRQQAAGLGDAFITKVNPLPPEIL